MKKGDVLYIYGGAIDPLFASKGMTKKFWCLCLTNIRTLGYKVIYTRSTNRITSKILYEFGSKVIKIVKITESGIKDEYVELLRLSM